MLYIYISDQCRNEAARHSQLERLEKLAKDLEKQQVADHLDPYYPVFAKKDFGRSFRLVIGKVHDGEDVLLIFWRFWPKSAREYSDFAIHYEQYIPKFQNDFSPKALQKIWADKRESPPETVVQEVSDDERAFLYNPIGFSQQGGDEWMVFESLEWVKRTKSGEDRSVHVQNFTGYISELYDLTLSALEKDDSLVGNEKVAVLYHRFFKKKILFLIAPVMQKDQADIDELKRKYQGKLHNEEDFYIARIARRAYPALLMGDEKLWMEIQQQDEKANLALSQEEGEFLQNTEGFYPLFINGRPGSGKSTILQYRFAEYLFQYLQYGHRISPPIYLTYSPELLSVARDNVSKLLTSNAFKLLEQQDKRIPKEKVQELTDRTFYVFREYLLNLLPNRDDFREDGYISYPRFRKLYEEKFGRHYNRALRSMAEIAWHVIRTYIKGNSIELDEFMDSETYREFPEKQKSVTQETFDLIYTEVWENWYSQVRENGYWDDQDLARSVLHALMEGDLADTFQGHSVVFCDEAQDFTRNELRLILRLSAFSRRKLTPDLLDRIPFAFAGDPFQTLNPTGFDWKRTKENLYIIIRDQIDKSENPNLDFNFKELTFNYRSRESIVQLGNFIHLLRGIAFEKTDLQPQNTWRDAPSDIPTFFDADSEIAQTYLRQQETNVIIVPCHEGEELDYVQNDPFLKTFALSEDGKSITRDVLSPMRAKGQEFDRVVLYKFGDVCVNEPQYQKLLALLDPDVEQRPNLPIDAQIPLEYFVNRLYVAASRAKKRVLIVDTRQGLDQFWRFFKDFDPEKFVQRYQAISPNRVWNASEHLVRIQPGASDDWEKDSNNPEELAEQFMQKGKRTSDAFLLERAARNYDLAGYENKALECEALAHEIRNEFLQAGQVYKRLQKEQQAETCFWKAKAFSEIVALKSETIYHRVANFMQSPDNYGAEQLDDLHEKIANGFKDGSLRPDEVWGEVLQAIYRVLLERQEDMLKPYQWGRIYQIANEYFQKGILSSDASTERRINLLLVRSTVYPEKLGALQKVGAQSKDILAYFEKNADRPLSPAQADIVFQAWRKEGKWPEAEAFLKKYPSIERYASLIVEHLRDGRNYRLEGGMLLEFFKFLIAISEWDIAFDFVTRQVLPVSESSLDILKKHKWGHLLDVAFIKALAVSDSLISAERSVLSRVSGYLADRLLARANEFHALVTVAQAGAALERANKIVDGLEFYEKVWDKQTWPATTEEQQFARERWLICKTRQRDQLVTSEEEKRKIGREIRTRQKEWKIEAFSHLPEYPNVNPLDKPVSAAPAAHNRPGSNKKESSLIEAVRPGRTEVDDLSKKMLSQVAEASQTADKDAEPGSETASQPQEQEKVNDESADMPELIRIQMDIADELFRVDVARARGKMTIRKKDEMETVTILAKNLKVQGSDDDFNAEIEARGNNQFFIRSWSLTCILRQHGFRVYVDIYAGDKQFEVCSFRLV